MSTIVNLFPPVGRVLLAFMFLLSGIQKAGAIEGTQGYMASAGLPGFLVYPATGFEILAPLAVIAGFYSRIAAFLLAGFALLTALLFHFDFADQVQSIMFMKNVSIAGGFLLLAANGPGAFSINNR